MVGMGEPAPVTSAYVNALAEKLVKEAAWGETWKAEDPGQWRQRAAIREAGTGITMDKRPYSPREWTVTEFDQLNRSTSGYRRPKLIEGLPSGSTQFVIQPPATPRQGWTCRSWTPVGSGEALSASLPPLPQSTPRPQSTSRQATVNFAESQPPSDKIHAHLAQLAKLFSHPTFGEEARQEFAELQKLLPRSGTQSSRDSLGTAAAVEHMKNLPLGASATTAQCHFQPPDDFGCIIRNIDRSRYYLKDKPVIYRENTLRTTGKILNFTFSNKYPSDSSAFVGKTAFPHWKNTPTVPKPPNLSEGRGAKSGGLMVAIHAK